MSIIKTQDISEAVARLFTEANTDIGQDVYDCIKNACSCEASPVGRSVLSTLVENYEIARREKTAVCQDTGMAIVFLELGQDAHITGGDLYEAVNSGVERAYSGLRKSVVSDPLFERRNTGTNTPAVIYTDIVPGEELKITALPKGFGSENMSAVKMLKPSDGVKGVFDFVVDTVKKAGPNPCPPTVIGVGIGGCLDKAALLSKKACAREIGSKNADARYAKLEEELLAAVNCLGIGPAGLGGNTTSLTVNIEWYPTHIAGLPVSVNVCCHAARHKSALLGGK